jgi:hypothetical protein
MAVMALAVTSSVSGSTPASPSVLPFSVRTVTPANNASIAGSVRWQVKVSGGRAHQVRFYIDGALRSVDDKSPFSVGKGGVLNTATLNGGPHELTVVAVQAGRLAGVSATASSTTTVVVKRATKTGAPLNISLPVVSGDTNVRAALTASSGNWQGSPRAYAYRWLRCDRDGVNCRRIGGAAAATYRLLTADAAHTLRSKVTASNAAGGTVATSSATPLIALSYSIRGMIDRDYSPTGFDQIARLGFNWIDSGPAQTMSLTGNLKAPVWLGGYNNATCTFYEPDTWVRQKVTMLLGNRHVGAYWVDDEPDAALCPSAPAQMKARSDLIHSLNPTAKTFIVIYKNEQFPLWKGTVDFFGIDKYPCNVKLNGCDYSGIDQATALADSLEMPYIGVIQAFGDDYYKMPTPAEIHTEFVHWRATKMIGYLVYAWHWPKNNSALWLANHREVQQQLAIENSR